MKIPTKAVEFIYLRTKYKYEHFDFEDFPAREYEKKYLSFFFSNMLQYGGISHYDSKSCENAYKNMINGLANTVRIFRMSSEPYLTSSEYLVWFDDNDIDTVNQIKILHNNFSEIFEQLDICGHKISLAKRAYFRKIDLCSINIRNSNLSYTNLEEADFSYTYMSHANLFYAKLKGADFAYAILRNTNLSHADLESADLSHADLENANLSYANLEKVNLSVSGK